MKAIVYRGTHEIGGTCIELIADNGKILWIDLGAPLDTKNANISYTQNKVDALLISHPHQDHFGLMENVGSQVPIYIGQVTLDLINATKLFLDKTPSSGNFQIIESWRNFIISDTFKIMPYLTDHSSPEAFAFLIEVDGKRVFYSGDFRSTGRKGILFTNLIKRPPPNIDLLLVEGTMVERSNHHYPTEDSVEEALVNVFRTQRNLSFVISSAQNIDRFVSVFRACRRTSKYMVIDIYTAWILDMVRKKAKGVPVIEWNEIKVYEHPGQLKKITDAAFDDFRNRIKQQSVGNSVFRSPSNFVYFLRCPNDKLVDEMRSQGQINVIYSQWDGYLREEHKTYSTDYINLLKKDKGISFQSIHTSGHATVADLVLFTKAINSKTIVPIHTANPQLFKTEFEKVGFANIVLWEDGKEYKL